jgi:hypothetical protein
MFKTSTIIFKEEKMKGFYKGMLSPLIGCGLQNALLFGVYGNTLNYLDEIYNNQKYLNIFISGSFSGIFNCIISSPSELIKTNLQTSSKYKGNIDFIVKSYKKHGIINGWYKGFISTCIRDIPSYFLFNNKVWFIFYGLRIFICFESG